MLVVITPVKKYTRVIYLLTIALIVGMYMMTMQGMTAENEKILEFFANLENGNFELVHRMLQTDEVVPNERLTYGGQNAFQRSIVRNRTEILYILITLMQDTRYQRGVQLRHYMNQSDLAGRTALDYLETQLSDPDHAEKKRDELKGLMQIMITLGARKGTGLRLPLLKRLRDQPATASAALADYHATKSAEQKPPIDVAEPHPTSSPVPAITVRRQDKDKEVDSGEGETKKSRKGKELATDGDETEDDDRLSYNQLRDMYDAHRVSQNREHSVAGPSSSTTSSEGNPAGSSPVTATNGQLLTQLLSLISMSSGAPVPPAPLLSGGVANMLPKLTESQINELPLLQQIILTDDLNSVLQLLTSIESETELKSIINAQDSNGDTAMHLACRLGNLELVQLLTAFKVDTSLKNRDGLTALALTQQLVKPSVSAGTAPVQSLPARSSADKGKEIEQPHRTPIAGYRSRDTGVSMPSMAAQGSTLGSPLPTLSETAFNALPVLHQIIRNDGALAAIGFLNDLQPQERVAAVNERDSNGETALHLACRLCDDNFVAVLIRCGIDKNIQNNNGLTALQLLEKLKDG